MVLNAPVNALLPLAAFPQSMEIRIRGKRRKSCSNDYHQYSETNVPNRRFFSLEIKPKEWHFHGCYCSDYLNKAESAVQRPDCLICQI